MGIAPCLVGADARLDLVDACGAALQLLGGGHRVLQKADARGEASAVEASGEAGLDQAVHVAGDVRRALAQRLGQLGVTQPIEGVAAQALSTRRARLTLSWVRLVLMRSAPSE